MPCYIERMKDGGTMFMCGNLGPHCAAEKCGALGVNLCDYPVGKGKPATSRCAIAMPMRLLQTSITALGIWCSGRNSETPVACNASWRTSSPTPAPSARAELAEKNQKHPGAIRSMTENTPRTPECL